MTLQEFIKANPDLVISDFARRLGVARQTLYAWGRGEQMPRPHHILRVEALTGGRVTANDFMLSFQGKAA